MLRPAATIVFAVAGHCACAGGISDSEAIAIARKHCVMCHAAEPTHKSFQEAPKNIRIETIADLKRYATAIYAQTVQTKAMPLGNETNMSDHERTRLGQWLKELP